MLRPTSSMTPASKSDPAKLPPLITQIPLPLSAFSLRTNSPASAGDELDAFLFDRLQRAREDVALHLRRAATALPACGSPTSCGRRAGCRVAFQKSRHELLDVLAEVQPVERAVPGGEESIETACAAVGHRSHRALLGYTKRRFRNDTKRPFTNCQPRHEGHEGHEARRARRTR